MGRKIWMMMWSSALCLGACGWSGPMTLKVMSFNLRYATASDGENSWPHRKDILIEAIRAQHPDVLGTQECLDVQAEYIEQKLPEYHWIGMGREKDGQGEMAAVFYRKAVLSPIETGNFWLSETPDVPGTKSWGSSCTRMATWVRFRHIASNTFFYYFNTHFDHASESAREHAAQVLLDRANALQGNPPVIVTGDFNANAENAAAYTTLIEGGFKDAWLAAAKREGPEITFGDFAAPPAGAKGRIDWILMRGPLKVERCETVLYKRDGHYPSDHYPVVAELFLTS